VNRENAFILAVVIVGLSLYVGAAAFGATVTDGRETAVDDPIALVAADADGGDAPSGGGVGDGGESTPTEEETFVFETAFNFTEASAAAGVNYTYESTVPGSTNRMMSNAGVYVADYDRDGWSDVLLTGGQRPRLYRNTGGAFEPTGALSGVDRDVRAAVWLDYDADGWEDLVLLSNGRAPLLLANEAGTFERRDAFAGAAPLDMPIGATTADFADDGCPDLLVVQNGNWSDRLPTGRHNYSATPATDNGEPDWLYRGDCTGFERTPPSEFRGTHWSLAAAATDLTGDGHPDAYVAHDFGHDVLYRNRGDGTFERRALGERTNRNGMAAEVTDLNGDGRPDVFVTNIYYPDWAAERLNAVLETKADGNNALVNTGNGSFDERGRTLGVTAGGWGWAAVAADLDNDGRRDLFHTTRELTFETRDVQFTDRQIDRLQDRPVYSGPALWAGTGEGEYRNVSSLLNGFESANGRGVARLDYDRDGDLDLLVATTGQFRLYRNGEYGVDRDGDAAVQVDVESATGAPAHGADVYVTAAGTDREQWRRVHSRTDYLSQESRVVHVGVGTADRATVRVVWPDGRARRFPNISVNKRIVVGPTGPAERVPLTGAGGGAGSGPAAIGRAAT
jgi:hypothetical protein